MIESLSHITLIVADLERAAEFLRQIFAAEELYDSGDNHFSLSREKFFLIGATWLVLMEGSRPAGRSYEHIAFKVAEADFDGYLSRIGELGVEMRPGRQRVEGEARSVYFYDYDSHLFEIHTGTLRERLLRYMRE
jgi:fosfomycin resistance protein FosX